MLAIFLMQVETAVDAAAKIAEGDPIRLVFIACLGCDRLHAVA